MDVLDVEAGSRAAGTSGMPFKSEDATGGSTWKRRGVGWGLTGRSPRPSEGTGERRLRLETDRMQTQTQLADSCSAASAAVDDGGVTWRSSAAASRSVVGPFGALFARPGWACRLAAATTTSSVAWRGVACRAAVVPTSLIFAERCAGLVSTVALASA